jgi:hypothetical protein
MEKWGGSPRYWKYEHRREPLASRAVFLRRVVAHGGAACGIVVAALAVGMFGYRLSEGTSWVDAFLNASMILGGMGEVTELGSRSGKLFASFYALYAGVAFLAVAAVLIAPFAHRLLHRLHIEDVERRGQGR